MLPSRKGPTIEIGNTDAEGRLILADALAEADSEKPALLIDMATLTGNARVAFGPELPTLFTRHDDLAADIARHSVERADPLWRMPLWPHYRKQLDSKIAHMNNVSDSAFAGAIIAGLFLAEFVSPETRWAHVDMSGWNFGSRPGRPEGGDAQAIRALFGIVGGPVGRKADRQPARIVAAAFSPTMMAAAFVLAFMSRGMIEASATRSPRTP